MNLEQIRNCAALPLPTTQCLLSSILCYTLHNPSGISNYQMWINKNATKLTNQAQIHFRTSLGASTETLYVQISFGTKICENSYILELLILKKVEKLMRMSVVLQDIWHWHFNFNLAPSVGDARWKMKVVTLLPVLILFNLSCTWMCEHNFMVISPTALELFHSKPQMSPSWWHQSH